MDDRFADIRPFTDGEAPGVIARLLGDREFIGAIARLKFKSLGWLLRPLVRRALTRELAVVRDVAGFQAIVERYMTRMIRESTAGLSVSGLERLERGRAHLFMSNHRDITLDPAFTNYALYHHGFDTVRIAIGDNLLTKPYVSDLMRLNKSFIVRRSAKGPREVLQAYGELSAYIRHSIAVDRAPVWLAQREGRAKDGVDRTEPAVIKMLGMSRDKRNETFGEHIKALNIVPVAIAYELDPCDARKAEELLAIAERGHYEKAEHEDVASIAAGITGWKGHIHVAFGAPLAGALETPEEVAAEVDRQIIANYGLHRTNLFACRMRGGDMPDLPEADRQSLERSSCSEREFADRINAMPERCRPHALAMYANALQGKLNARNNLSGPGQCA